ncbi:hypothetical protein Rsub_11128 [Raphidocelis subcapitata]|uniref:Uncharacterized protein n=1 Tax=Raphidocelis subcapitata TaxID=307507 RepID=A0A2V0PL13_9CHLO|nr:hypothetical protein Rsub_11128 [Raphidocelis subcapitata]|eukprot:GBF98017.1 hypothetical protein Rsub_11128 [Raphidocelis subcapitata]
MNYSTYNTKIACPTASATGDTVCDDAKGGLTFTINTAPGLPTLQCTSATLVVTDSTGEDVPANKCSRSCASRGITVQCTDLAPGIYTLAASVPDTQYPGCPSTARVSGEVKKYGAPNVVVDPLNQEAPTVCKGAAPAGFTFKVDTDPSGFEITVQDTTHCNWDSATKIVTCSGVTQTTALHVQAKYGGGGECLTSPKAVTVSTEQIIKIDSISPVNDQICPTGSGKGDITYTITTSAVATGVNIQLKGPESADDAALCICSSCGPPSNVFTVTCKGLGEGSYTLKAQAVGGVCSNPWAESLRPATVTFYDYKIIANTSQQAGTSQKTMVCPETTASFLIPVSLDGHLLPSDVILGKDPCVISDSTYVSVWKKQTPEVDHIDTEVEYLCPDKTPATADLTFTVNTTKPASAVTARLISGSVDVSAQYKCNAEPGDHLGVRSRKVTCRDLPAGEYVLEVTPYSLVLACRGEPVNSTVATVPRLDSEVKAGNKEVRRVDRGKCHNDYTRTLGYRKTNGDMNGYILNGSIKLWWICVQGSCSGSRSNTAGGSGYSQTIAIF